MIHYLFVESNTTGSGAMAIRMLRAQGHDVTFLTRDRSRYPFLGDTCVVDVDTNDPDALASCVGQLTATHPVNAVVTFSTFYVATVAALAARLGLPFLNERTARTCHDKIAARRALQAAGLPNPSFWAIESEADAARVAAEVPYPCIMKPAADSGSTGVLRIENEGQFRDHYRRLSSASTNDRGQSVQSAVLVEELLEGAEVSVESMTLALGSTRIIGITLKHLSAPPYFVELGHDFPAPLPAAGRIVIEQAVIQALDAAGYDFGPAHTEVRLTARGPIIVEINPRLAGGMIPELVRLATGIDLLDQYLGMLRREPPSLTAARDLHASIRFLVATKPGTLKTAPPFDDLLKLPGVDQISYDIKRNPVAVPCSSADRLGFVICSGNDSSSTAQRATEVARVLTARLESALG